MTQKIYTMKNDFMFKTVMSDEENLKPFLQRLFPEKTFKKLIIEQEKSLKASVNSHGVRLDITATDEEGVYNVEMNSLYTVTSLRRGRYYASSLDISLLKPDTKYEELPNVTVVFVISNDLFCDNILYSIRFISQLLFHYYQLTVKLYQKVIRKSNNMIYYYHRGE